MSEVNHEGMVRGFFLLSEAWYGESNLATLSLATLPVADEVMLGWYAPEGGTAGEFRVEWIELAGKLCPRIGCFSDGWGVLFSDEFADLRAELVELHDFDPTPKEFCDMLLRLGFTDLTPRER